MCISIIYLHSLINSNICSSNKFIRCTSETWIIKKFVFHMVRVQEIQCPDQALQQVLHSVVSKLHQAVTPVKVAQSSGFASRVWVALTVAGHIFFYICGVWTRSCNRSFCGVQIPLSCDLSHSHNFLALLHVFRVAGWVCLHVFYCMVSLNSV